ncbi:ArnT family glycosyltransferase [Promicromonospora sukumoe]|uniref:ArnT family glycosyltransferase n=1 Tax=Promicromonospora sukumoe TaxID=88382 RepID=UPI0037C64C46
MSTPTTLASAIARASAPAPRGRLHVVALVVLLGATAALYLTGITVSGWGNVFYAAAAQAGAHSGHAMLYGASDMPASITVDKPPASIWLMALSVRLLGLSPFAVLLPQALLGVATVALVYVTVRRVAGPGAGLLAGAVAATTPVSALIFRYNNPDALLTALLALAAYATVRAIEHARVRWVVLVGAAIGFAFLTKQLQAFLVVPGLVLGYLVAAPVPVRRRILHLGIAAAAVLVSAGWWVAIVQIVPAADRPYIGGTTTNSFLDLTFGYNGLGRLVGGSGNGTLGSGAGLLRLLAGFTGLRMLVGNTGRGVAWLLPAAFVLGAAALVLLARRPRTDARRALLLVSLGTLVVSAVAFSVMAGIYHSYYTVAMVPALAAVIAVSAEVVWSRRAERQARVVLAAVVAGTAVWTSVLLLSTPAALFPLAVVVLVAGAVAAVLLLGPGWAPGRSRPVMASALVVALLVPLAASITTAAVPHSGSGPTTSYASAPDVTPSPAVVALLERSGGTNWAAAVDGSVPAARYQLASGRAVMPIGGFKGIDPTPTLQQFQARVAAGRVHWFIGSDGEIGRWVAANYPQTQVGGTTLYDLTAPPGQPAPGQVPGAVTPGARQ